MKDTPNAIKDTPKLYLQPSTLGRAQNPLGWCRDLSSARVAAGGGRATPGPHDPRGERSRARSGDGSGMCPGTAQEGTGDAASSEARSWPDLCP